MSDLPPNAAPAPLPTAREVMSFLQTLQSSLGAYVQADTRNDANAKAQASARVMGAYRKIVSIYGVLDVESRRDLAGPIQALHETIVSLGIPLGPCRIEIPPPPAPVDEAADPVPEPLEGAPEA